MRFILITEFADFKTLDHGLVIYIFLNILWIKLILTDKVLHKSKYDYNITHAISWLMQIANAVCFLHELTPQPIIHRDLKPEK